MKALFKKLDESGDGKIQRAEFANALAKKAAKNEKRSKLLRDPPNLKSAEDMAGLTTRNHNYVASRVKALPTCAQLDPNDELSVEEQLGMLLTLHRTTIMQLFHDWDIDGNGGVDKKEFRKAIALLGYSVKKKQIDALFDRLDVDKEGFIDFGELKKALHKHTHKSTLPKHDQSKGQKMALQIKEDKQLTYEEFKGLVEEREGLASEDHVKAAFAAFDVDGSGTVDMCEYLMYSVHNALMHTSDRATDLFAAWDESGDGNIDENEFASGLQSLKFEVPAAVSKKLFRMLDGDRSGTLKYAELKTILTRNLGEKLTKLKLLNGPEGKNLERGAMLDAKTANQNFVVGRVRALPPIAKLVPNDDHSVAEQIALLLKMHHVKLIDLFRDWDENGDGGIDRKEFRKGLAALGYTAGAKEIDALHAELDIDKSNFVEFEELKLAVTKAVRVKHDPKDKQAEAASATEAEKVPAPPAGDKPPNPSPRKS